MIFFCHRFDGELPMTIQPESQLAFGGGKPAGNPWILLTGNIYGLGKSFEERLNDVVRFIPIQQFQMEVAPGFIGKTLKKLARQSEPESAGHILSLLGLAD
jgi:hypothetical protein